MKIIFIAVIDVAFVKWREKALFYLLLKIQKHNLNIRHFHRKITDENYFHGMMAAMMLKADGRAC
jgi:hypothetical protein